MSLATPSADPLSVARQQFLALLHCGAHLLEAGCGEGDDLCFFRQQGLVVTAFDARLAQARVASRRSGQPVRVCRIDQLRSVVPYDGIWARGALPLLAASELSEALAHLAGLLKPAGPLYCAFPHASGQPASSDDTPEAASPLAEDRLSRLDEEGLRRLIAPLPLQLQQCWESERTDGRWLHALLLRS
nr:class I SAM-dependent methyltransferase [Aeromonas dhakensis]